MSDDEVLSATQLLEQFVHEDDDVLVACSQQEATRKFLAPVAQKDLQSLVDTRFPKRTVHQSTWAVTLFGDWRAHRNRLCLEGNADASLYIDKYGVSPSFLNCIDLLRHNIE